MSSFTLVTKGTRVLSVTNRSLSFSLRLRSAITWPPPRSEVLRAFVFWFHSESSLSLRPSDSCFTPITSFAAERWGKVIKAFFSIHWGFPPNCCCCCCSKDLFLQLLKAPEPGLLITSGFPFSGLSCCHATILANSYTFHLPSYI